MSRKICLVEKILDTSFFYFFIYLFISLSIVVCLTLRLTGRNINPGCGCNSHFKQCCQNSKWQNNLQPHDKAPAALSSVQKTDNVKEISKDRLLYPEEEQDK